MDKTIEETKRIDASSFLDLHATFLNHDSLEEATTAYLTVLANRLNCARISAGINEHNSFKIIAISNESNVKHLELNPFLISAMDECYSQNSMLTYPTDPDEQPKIVLALATLSQQTGHHLVAVPMMHQEKILGVLLFELAEKLERDNDEILTIERAASLFSPLLKLKLEANQTIPTMLVNRLKKAWHGDTENAFKYKKELIGLSAFLLIASLFLPVSHYVGAPARLEGAIQRALVASEDGFLQQSYVRPGDLVKENQVLAELADQDLTLMQQQKESELAQYQNAYGASLAASDRVQMMINQSKMDEVQSQLMLIKQKIARAKLTAPFDGVIIKGDLQQSIGAPVQKGDALITISPVNAFRLMVEVDERDVDLVETSQSGLLALVSLPDVKIPFEVKNINPVAIAKDGRNYFEVEAEIAPTDTKLRLQPGMEGVAKISAGKASIIWSITHRFFDWLKLTLWSWGW